LAHRIEDRLKPHRISRRNALSEVMGRVTASAGPGLRPSLLLRVHSRRHSDCFAESPDKRADALIARCPSHPTGYGGYARSMAAFP
jgi:hypothetical protein